MNKTMTVYFPNGEQYFHTATVPPIDETREEDYWVAQGYVVVFTESVAAQESSDVRESVKTSRVISDRPSSMLTPAPAADHTIWACVGLFMAVGIIKTVFLSGIFNVSSSSQSKE